MCSPGIATQAEDLIADGAFHDTAVAGLYGCNGEIVEMEGAGLFSVAQFRSCRAAGIYVISDSGEGGDRDLGWGEAVLETSVGKVIDAIADKG